MNAADFAACRVEPVQSQDWSLHGQPITGNPTAKNIETAMVIEGCYGCSNGETGDRGASANGGPGFIGTASYAATVPDSAGIVGSGSGRRDAAAVPGFSFGVGRRSCVFLD
jgi:hypothetical protein